MYPSSRIYNPFPSSTTCEEIKSCFFDILYSSFFVPWSHCAPKSIWPVGRDNVLIRPPILSCASMSKISSQPDSISVLAADKPEIPAPIMAIWHFRGRKLRKIIKAFKENIATTN